MPSAKLDATSGKSGYDNSRSARSPIQISSVISASTGIISIASAYAEIATFEGIMAIAVSNDNVDENNFFITKPPLKQLFPIP